MDKKENEGCGVGMMMTADAGEDRLQRDAGKREDTYHGACARRVLEVAGALSEGGLHPLPRRRW